LSSISEDITTAAWADYQADRTTERRNAIVEHYLPWADHVAAGRAARLPAHIELDDVQSLAREALIWCVERFEPDRGVWFKSWARQRIAGMILDGMRRQDWVPKNKRKQAKADGTECDLAQVWQWQETPTHCTGREEPDRLHPPSKEPSPLDRAEADDFKRHVYRGLDAPQRLIVMLYYGAGMTMKEAARVIGVSESRTSQHLQTIKAILKARFGARLAREAHSAKGRSSAPEHRATQKRERRQLQAQI